MGKKTSRVVVGRRDVKLTAEVVYDVAYGLADVELDPGSLQHIAQSSKKAASSALIERPKFLVGSPDGRRLQDVELRATLVVVLHKLLVGSSAIRTFLPVFIAEVLNLGLPIDLPDRSTNLAVIKDFIFIVYKTKTSIESLEDSTGEEILGRLKTALKTAEVGEIGVTEVEMAALESTFAASAGVAALATYTLTSLVGVADAVVALSIEALQASPPESDSASSKQNFGSKSEDDVANDLKSLLSGSKLVRASKAGENAGCFRGVPASHGALLDSVKFLAPKLSVELNRVENVEKRNARVERFSGYPALAALSESSSSSLFTSAMLSLVGCLLPNILGSFERTLKSLATLRELSPDDSAIRSNRDVETAHEIRSLKNRLKVAAGTAAVSGAENELFLSREIWSAVETWRKFHVEEGAAALGLLALRESLSEGKAEDQGRRESEGRASNSGSKKPAKEKKKFVLGKGTELVRQCFAGYIGTEGDEERLDDLLQPHTQELQGLLADLKTVLEGNETRRLPKVPKGTRDFKPEQMAIRQKVFAVINSIFQRHGAVAIDTPVFELKETLTGKYGEDSKLIYDLADQGGEILSLRYDLTVPFARYLALNKVESMKRYHIGKVYRRDNPAKGRYREFYQCDLDIAGQYPLMIPDFEVLKVLTELLNELNIGDYEVKLNHRKLLDGMLDICGVPQEKFRAICSAIDKLDKLPWEQVCKEMVEEKGLSPETAENIGGLVQKRGSPLVLLKELKQADSPFLQHTGSTVALDELGVLFEYLEAAKCLDRIVFDLSLARGLDYYTGVIYEAVFKGTEQVGSIAAGGRYDNLVGMFSGKQVPAVGVSLGIERVFTIMEQQLVEQQHLDPTKVIRSNQTEVLVIVIGNDVEWRKVAIKMVSEIWEGNVNAEFDCVSRGKMSKRIADAAKMGIPWVVLAGEDEINKGIVGLKNIFARTQDDVRREDLVAELQKRLGVVSKSPLVVT